MSIENDVKLGIIGIQSGTLKGLLAWVRVNLSFMVMMGQDTVTIKKEELEKWEKIIVQVLKADTSEKDIALVGRTDNEKEKEKEN